MKSIIINHYGMYKTYTAQNTFDDTVRILGKSLDKWLMIIHLNKVGVSDIFDQNIK